MKLPTFVDMPLACPICSAGPIGIRSGGVMFTHYFSCGNAYTRALDLSGWVPQLHAYCKRAAELVLDLREENARLHEALKHPS